MGIEAVISGAGGLGERFGGVITGIGTGFTTLIGNITSPFTTLQNTLGALDFGPFSKLLNIDFSKVTEFFNLGTAFETATAFVKSLTGSLPGISSGGDGGGAWYDPLDVLN